MTEKEIEEKALFFYPIRREYSSFGIEEDANKPFRHAFTMGATMALTKQWISTKALLPEPTQISKRTYLTRDVNGWYDVMAKNLDGWSSDGRWCADNVVTHWMEIPDVI